MLPGVRCPGLVVAHIGNFVDHNPACLQCIWLPQYSHQGTSIRDGIEDAQTIAGNSTIQIFPTVGHYDVRGPDWQTEDSDEIRFGALLPMDGPPNAYNARRMHSLGYYSRVGRVADVYFRLPRMSSQ